MSNVVSCEQFLLQRVANEQRRAADSMRDMVAAVGQFVTTVDHACGEARSELALALARTTALQEAGAAERERSLEALEDGSLDVMIAERDRLIAARACR